MSMEISPGFKSIFGDALDEFVAEVERREEALMATLSPAEQAARLQLVAEGLNEPDEEDEECTPWEVVEREIFGHLDATPTTD